MPAFNWNNLAGLLGLGRLGVGRGGDLAEESNRAAGADWLGGDRRYGVNQTEYISEQYPYYFRRSSAVGASIRLRANSLALLGFTVLRDGVEVGPGDAVAQLLARPNPQQTGFDFLYSVETHLCIWGLAYLAVERDRAGSGGGLELWNLRPDRMRVLTGRRSGDIEGYQYRGASGRLVTYLADEIVPVRYHNPFQPVLGISPLDSVYHSADMSIDGSRYNAGIFRDGASPDYLFLTEQPLTDREVDEFYVRWEQRYQGGAFGGRRRPALAGAVRDVKALGISNRDLEFRQMLSWSVEDCGRAFGVPGPLLNDLRDATLQNVAALEQSFWRNTIQPEGRRIGAVMAQVLLPLLGYSGYELILDLERATVFREADRERYERETAFVEGGILTINELRELRGLGPVDWGDRPPWERGEGSGGG